MLLFLSLGCSFGLSRVAPGDTTVQDSATRVDAITPNLGLPSGGTPVTVSGAGFTGDVAVTFGGIAGAVTVVDTKTLVVTTPRVGSEVTVDVKVISDNGADTVAGGFTFTWDAPEDDTGGDTGSHGSGSTYPGMIAGLVSYEYTDIACPVCFSLPSDEPPSISVAAVFHAPTDGSWLDWLPAEGACTEDLTPSTLASRYLNAGSALTITDGTQVVSVPGATTGGGWSYAAQGLAETVYTFGTSWDLVAPGGPDLDLFALEDMLVTPLAFTSETPPSVFSESSGNAYTSLISSSGGGSIGWSPSGTGDFVLVTLEASSGSTSLGSATCRYADSGTGFVPGSALSRWPAGARLVVRLARYQAQDALLPNEAIVQTLSKFELVGTAQIGL